MNRKYHSILSLSASTFFGVAVLGCPPKGHIGTVQPPIVIPQDVECDKQRTKVGKYTCCVRLALGNYTESIDAKDIRKFDLDVGIDVGIYGGRAKTIREVDKSLDQTFSGAPQLNLDKVRQDCRELATQDDVVGETVSDVRLPQVPISELATFTFPRTFSVEPGRPYGVSLRARIEPENKGADPARADWHYKLHVDCEGKTVLTFPKGGKMQSYHGGWQQSLLDTERVVFTNEKVQCNITVEHVQAAPDAHGALIFHELAVEVQPIEEVQANTTSAVRGDCPTVPESCEQKALADEMYSVKCKVVSGNSYSIGAQISLVGEPGLHGAVEMFRCPLGQKCSPNPVVRRTFELGKLEEQPEVVSIANSDTVLSEGFGFDSGSESILFFNTVVRVSENSRSKIAIRRGCITELKSN